MASTQNGKAVNLIAGEDLRGDFGELLKIEDDADVGKVIKTTAVTDSPIGVLAENPDGAATTDGETVPVALLGGGGVLKMKAGGVVTAGDLIVPDVTAGRVIGVANQAALVADSTAIGIALESAVDGDLFEVLVQVMTSSTET